MNQKTSQSPHRKLTAVALVSVLTLLIANLLVSNILATNGEQLRQLQQRSNNLQDQNTRLRQGIIEKSALHTLEARAQELGFIKSRQTMSITSQPPVAMHQQ